MANLIPCTCGHWHDGDVCDDCPCRIYTQRQNPITALPQTMLVMANAHGYQAQINADDSVTVWIPWTKSDKSLGVDPWTCRTVHDMRHALGY